MAIFGNQSSDINASFNVSNNIKDLSANLALRDKAMFDMAQKFSDTNEEMAQLRATAGQIISQYGVDEKGRPSDSAPKYIHDIYKGIQKEGGIEGLPKSSLMQAIKGYETGFQIDSQRQKIEQNQQSLELNRYNLETARLQAQQQQRMIKASEEASNLDVSKKTKKTVTQTGVKDVNTGIYGTENMQEGLNALTAPQVGSKVNYTKQEKFNPADTFKEYMPSETAERDLQEKKLARESIANSVLEKNSKLEKEIAQIEQRLPQLRSVVSTRTYDVNDQFWTARDPVTGYFDPSRVKKQAAEIQENKAEELKLIGRLNDAKKEIGNNKNTLLSSLNELPVGLQPALAQPKKKAPNVRYPTSTTREIEVDKNEDEIIKEEYGVLTSRLKSMGQLPLNWSENTFRQIKGYAPSVEFKTSGGMPFVRIGNEWQLASGMMKQPTISESIALEKQQVYKSAIRSDRLSDDKWEFQGDMRVEDANTAGKIGREAKDLTRSLDALDRLIELGSTGKWESLLPTQKAGIIDALTNSVRAAGRTEIAGSGAFSEKDADYLNSIVPSFASMSGAVFREQAIAKLTEYRNRIQMKVQDFGKAYGFSVQQRSNTGLSGDQQAELKLIYTNLLKQGVSPEQARQMAIQSLYQQ